MNIALPPPGRSVRCAVLISALLLRGAAVCGQSTDSPAAAPTTDAEKRLEWLKSRLPPKAAAPPKVASAPKASPTPKPAAAPKIGFRSNPQAVGTRSIDAEPPTPRATPPAETATTAESPPAKAKGTEAPPAKSKTAKTAESRPPKATPAPTAKVTAPAATPAAKPSVAETSPKSSPAPVAKRTTPSIAKEPPPAKDRTAEARATPAPKATPAPATASTKSTTPKALPAAASSSPAKGRYPWKTGIVTTVFWIGERPAGNNFTPNRSSSWDANWAQSYGGFDNPDPAARRNFIPVKFTPRQNPFYVALPYNDVTHGTTKPEARRVIPWFKEAFRHEGHSICRDRWVAIRNRAGKTVYAQWSDCGPFRTDHWEYVFGNEKPKPNLNQGAGLDVSPAVRDCLGIDSTDVTDWKFVDFKDVPSGPWARYGQNNTFVLKEAKPAKSSSKPSGRTADYATRVRAREL